MDDNRRSRPQWYDTKSRSAYLDSAASTAAHEEALQSAGFGERERQLILLHYESTRATTDGSKVRCAVVAIGKGGDVKAQCVDINGSHVFLYASGGDAPIARWSRDLAVEVDPTAAPLVRAVQRAITPYPSLYKYSFADLAAYESSQREPKSALLEALERELEETLFFADWSETDARTCRTAFETLSPRGRDALLNRLACAVGEKKLAVKEHPLLEHELKWERLGLSFVMAEDESHNLEDELKILSDWGKKQLLDYWVNIECELYPGEDVDRTFSEFIDRSGKIVYHAFESYIDGRIYEAESLEIIGYCSQHRADHQEEQRSAAAAVERARRLAGDSGKNVRYSNLDEDEDLSSVLPIELLNRFDRLFSKRRWSDQQRLDFWCRAEDLSHEEYERLLNGLAIALKLGRLDSKSLPLL